MYTMLIQWKQERGLGTAPEPAPRPGCPPRGVRGEPGTLTCAGKEGRGGHPAALNWFGGTRVAPGRRPGAELLVLAGLCPAGASWCPPRLHSPCVLPPWEHPGLHPSTPTQCLPSSPAFRPGAACKEQNLGEKGGGRDSASPAHSLRPGRAPSGSRAHARGTHIVVLEGMEKVASQLPVVSWSARGIANATYVVWRILQKTKRGGGEQVPASPEHHRAGTRPRRPRSRPHPRLGERRGLTQPPSSSLTFGSPSMSPDPVAWGQKEKSLVEGAPAALAPSCPAPPFHFSPRAWKPRGLAGRGGSTHLRIRSCDGAPCRPCRPWGRQSRGPLGTADEKTTPTST